MVQHKILGKTVQHGQASLVVASDERGRLGPIMAEQLRQFGRIGPVSRDNPVAISMIALWCRPEWESDY